MILLCHSTNQDVVNVWQARVDLLIWQARENGLSFAIVDQKVVEPSFHTHLGARLELDRLLCHDEWQLIFQFTHFHARTNETISGGLIRPIWAHPGRGIGFAQEASNRWRLHLGFVDLWLGRSLGEECVKIEPFFGLRFAGVRHKMRVGYDEEDLSMKNKFWGLGPVMGAAVKVDLPKGWLVYARGLGALLYGRFYVHQDEERAHHKEEGRLKYLDSFALGRALAELEAGFGWERQLGCVCVGFTFGWSICQLFGQNVLTQFLSSQMPALGYSNLGDLTLQGAVLGFNLKY